MRRLPNPSKSLRLSSSEVASVLGISLRTLRRKLASGGIPEPERDTSNNYRMWRPEEVEAIRQQIQRGKA